MSHWINQTPMNFFVGKRSGLVAECCPMYSNIEGSFRSEIRAIEFAKALHDGLNFIMVYGDDGKVVHILGPGMV